jgi:segregation and condensation protein B
VIERDRRAEDQPDRSNDSQHASADPPDPGADRTTDHAAPAAGPVTDPATEPLGLTEAGLEALLFVAERPLARREIATLAGVDRETVDARVGDLEISLAARGIRLVTSGDRVELATAPEAGRLIGRYVGADATRLSPAALETLAIVAYRQPVTRGGVERIRGVDSDYTMRALLHRRLIVELSRAETPGRPYLYGTDFEFLERFGIASLDQLPPLDAEVAARLVEADESAPDAPDDDDRGPGVAVGPGPA